jgi:phosphatidylglycerol---prolipoprotein diacylglyceryl transferase
MIPWIESQTFHLGPIPIQTWGTFVAAGFLLGVVLAARRAQAKGLDPKVIWDVSFWLFIAAFVGSRIFHVLFYEFDYYRLHPLEAFDPRKPGFAIYGGFLACALVYWWFTRRRKINFLEYGDILIWGVPWGCGVGRIGCFLIHDHPGTLSNSLLAVKYPDGQARHDLGLYLSITGFVIGLIFLVLNRKPRHRGFWFGAYLFLDSLSRIWLDFYRVVDVKYLGLTPTQWLTIPLALIGAWLVFDPHRKLTKKFSLIFSDPNY